MPKEAVFTMKIESELRAAFMAETAAVDRPASQILREMMLDYIQRQQQAREYETFLNQKVARAHRSRLQLTAVPLANRGEVNNLLSMNFPYPRLISRMKECLEC